MRRTVFVERELEARRGRRKQNIVLRVFKPVPDRGHWNCSFEIEVDGKKLWTPDHLSGVDGIQALLMAIGFMVFTLEGFERDSGMRVEEWAWLDVWTLRPQIGAVGDAKRRAAFVRKAKKRRRSMLAAQRRAKTRTSRTSQPRA